MQVKLNLQNKIVPCISLSDNGSTLSFLSSRFIKKFRLSSLWVWRGSVQTLSDTKNVSTDFYKLSVQTTQGHQAVLALKTDGLGEYFGINYKMAVKFAAHFGLDPEDVLCATHEPIDLLLGVDAVSLLLDKVMQLNGKTLSWLLGLLIFIFMVLMHLVSFP